MLNNRAIKHFLLLSLSFLVVSLLLTACMLIEEPVSPVEEETETGEVANTPIAEENEAAEDTTPTASPQEEEPENSNAEAMVETSMPPQSTATETPVQEPEQPTILTGIGLLGASTLDEYHGSENRGGEYHYTTFNMVELLAMYRDFNFGEWGDWGEPRRIGYEYNWAKTGATSRTLIEQGQHTGLAEQVANGEITFVLMLVGANDFGPHTRYYADIYNGHTDDAELAQKVEQAIADVTLATDTILDAGVQGMAIVPFPSWETQANVLKRYPLAEKRQRIENAIAAVNEGIRSMAEERGVIVVETDALVNNLLLQVDENGYLNVDGELIDFVNWGNDPYHARLDDRSGHPGTVMSGLMANFIFIETLNTYFGTDVLPFSQEEILTFSGIREPE